MDKALRDIRSILEQAGDPMKFRQGLARRHGLDVTEIDALIATAGPARIASEETIALERVQAEAAAPRTDAWREYSHEEE